MVVVIWCDEMWMMEIMNTDHDDSNNNISDSCKRNVVFIPLQKDKLD